MGYKTRVQRIDRKDNRQYYLMCPTALAEALELEKGEEIEWVIERKDLIVLKRTVAVKEKGRK